MYHGIWVLWNLINLLPIKEYTNAPGKEPIEVAKRYFNNVIELINNYKVKLINVENKKKTALKSSKTSKHKLFKNIPQLLLKNKNTKKLRTKII